MFELFESIRRGPRAIAKRVRRLLRGEQHPYRAWLSRHEATRATRYPRASGRLKFTVITPVYEKTNLFFFEETARSILSQNYRHFEWIVVADGSISNELLVKIQRLRVDARVRFHALGKGGIIRTMRHALEQATGDYLIPIDGDDLIPHDALAVMASAIESNEQPAFLYSDEDHLIGGRPDVPYFRPDWDPVLNIASSFVWHLLAFDRRVALELGVYSDEASNWCHDWDTVFRFADAGHVPFHVREVLYHWRQHEASSTNQANPVSDSLLSQRHVIEEHLRRKGLSDRFEIEDFPLFRGAKEWWTRRKPFSDRKVSVILVGSGDADPSAIAARLRSYVGERLSEIIFAKPGVDGLMQAISKVEADLVAIFDTRVEVEGDRWLWEAEGQFDLHQDCVLISARLVDGNAKVEAGAEIFGPGGLVSVPNYGAPQEDAGMFALSLKPRSVSAVDSRFFIARANFLRSAIAQLPPRVTLAGLGACLGAVAQESGQRVVFSPLVSASWRGAPLAGVGSWGEREREAFLGAHGAKVPDTRWYLPHAGLHERDLLISPLAGD